VLQTIIELVLGPLLVGASGMAGRRWGPQTGGLVSAFPAIVGPVLLIAALDHGTRFAARAADGTLLGLVALSAFALTYARVAAHASWRASLLAAWAAASVSAAALGVAAGREGPPTGLLVGGLSLFAAHRLLGTGAPALAPPTAFPDPGSLPLRMLATALLVTALAASTRAFGAVPGGILAALPVLASVLAVATHRQRGAASVLMLMRGMLAGMIGFVAFCEALVLMLASAGVAVAFAISAVVAAGAQLATLLALGSVQQRPQHDHQQTQHDAQAGLGREVSWTRLLADSHCDFDDHHHHRRGPGRHDHGGIEFDPGEPANHQCQQGKRGAEEDRELVGHRLQ
jgi:hypothetical protein